MLSEQADNVRYEFEGELAKNTIHLDHDTILLV